MRRWSIIGLMFLGSCVLRSAGKAHAEPAAPAAAGAPAAPGALHLNSKSSVDDVLIALQQSGKDVQSFTADVVDTEDDQIQGTEVIRYGQVWFKTTGNGNAVLHLLLSEKEIAKKKIAERIEYLLEDGWLTMRNFDQKKEARLQLVPTGQKMNLFQLGKGPFPMPIGQDPNDVHAEFDVTIPPVDKENPDPQGTIHILLSPKPQAPLAHDFDSIDVWTDFASRMPVQIMTENKPKTELKTWTLLNLKVNPTLDKRDLALPALEAGWQSTEKKL